MEDWGGILEEGWGGRGEVVNDWKVREGLGGR